MRPNGCRQVQPSAGAIEHVLAYAGKQVQAPTSWVAPPLATAPAAVVVQQLQQHRNDSTTKSKPKINNLNINYAITGCIQMMRGSEILKWGENMYWVVSGEEGMWEHLSRYRCDYWV